jgi:hypothetical protein
MPGLTRKRTLGALALGGALVVAAAAPSAQAATLNAPATAAVGGHVSVTASKLIAGRYQLFLAYTKQTKNGAVNCIGAIGPARSVQSSGTFGGAIPSTLTCRTNSGAAAGTEAVRSGRYDIALYSPVGPNQYNGRRSFVQRSITITG